MWGEVRWGKQPKWNKMMRKSWPGVENLSQQAKQQKIDSKRKRAMTFRGQLSVSAEWITDMSRERGKTVKRQPIGRGRGTRVVTLAYFTHCTPDDCPWLLIPDDSHVQKKKEKSKSLIRRVFFVQYANAITEGTVCNFPTEMDVW